MKTRLTKRRWLLVGLLVALLGGAVVLFMCTRQAQISTVTPDEAELQTNRGFTLTVDIPNFTVDLNTQGSALVQPGNGGSTFAEPYGPIMPQVIQRFVLPSEATDIAIVENETARESELYGTVQLQTAVPKLRGETSNMRHHSSSFPITSIYPAQSFWYDITDQQDGIQVTLSVIPAQYEPNGELTLFNHMEFNVSYTMPTPDVTIDNVVVNNGQPVGINQASLPLSVTVTTPQAQSLKLQLEIVDPSGRAIGSASQIVSLLAGSNEISLDLDSGGWTPGAKTLWVSIGHEDAILDSQVLPFSALGVRVKASIADPSVAPGATVPLILTVRDENGALVSGLADRIAITMDGTSVQPTVTEEKTGIYRAELATTRLDLGMHQVGVQVTDLRDISGQGIVEFTIG